MAPRENPELRGQPVRKALRASRACLGLRGRRDPKVHRDRRALQEQRAIGVIPDRLARPSDRFRRTARSAASRPKR